MKSATASAALAVILAANSAIAFAPSPRHVSADAVISRSISPDVFGSVRGFSSTSASTASTSLEMQSFLGDIFGGEKKAAKPVAPRIPDFVVSPSYSLAIGFVFYSLFFVVALQASILGVILGGLNLLFASFLAVQTNRLRFVFDETSFELKSALNGDELSDTGENVVVGGANRWTYDSFVNWDFFPSRDIPILVYFKETQTPSEQWNEGPGQFDEMGGGQIHFFPAIADCRQLEEQFKIRGCAKMED